MSEHSKGARDLQQSAMTASEVLVSERSKGALWKVRQPIHESLYVQKAAEVGHIQGMPGSAIPAAVVLASQCCSDVQVAALSCH